MTISTAFIITSLVVVLVPGTGVIYTVSMGISASRRASLFAALGCTLGIVPHLIAGILGLSALLHSSAQIFQIIKFIGIIYLVYLGFNLIIKSNSIQINKEKDEKAFKIITRGILLNLLNPKLTLFFFSFLPQFITKNRIPYIYQMIILSIIFMILTLIIFVIYGVLANSFKHLFVSSPKIVKRIQQALGTILIGFAIKLALTED